MNIFDLFKEMKNFTDNEEVMKEFCNLIVRFSDNMKGNVKCVAICSGDFGFKSGHIYIMYDDMSSNTSFQMLDADDFINYIIDDFIEASHQNDMFEEDLTYTFKEKLENFY